MAIEKTTRRLLQVYTFFTSWHLFRLMSCEDENSALSDLLREWKPTIGIKTLMQLRGIWAVARWAYGQALGYLHSILPKTKSLKPLQLQQLPGWYIGSLSAPRPAQPPQATMAYRWFTDWIDMSDLKVGIAPRPFDPVNGGAWDISKYNSAHDASKVDECLTFVAAQRGITITHALQAVRHSPFEWAAWESDGNGGISEGSLIMEQISMCCCICDR